MSAKFVISHLDQQMGPFSEPELKAKWSKGELLPIDYVFDEAKNDWILLAERFDWAGAPKSEANPPPLRPNTIKKKAAPNLERSQVTQVTNVTQPSITQPSITHPVTQPQTAPTQSPALQPVAAQQIPAMQPQAPQNFNVTPVMIQHTPVQRPLIQTTPLVPDPAPPKVEISSQTLVKDWKTPTGQQGAKVKIVDGMGEIDISALNPGQVELALQDSSAGTLKLQQPLRVQVKALEPEEITWNFAQQVTVGQDFEISVKAVDGKGTHCQHYNDDFTIKISGTEQRDVFVKMTNGQATVKLSNTKAEVWKISFYYGGTRILRIPETKMVEWQPGAAARLILDGPPELIAGNPLKVQVKAVDQYGNLARTFQGTVILEVKAS